MDHFYQNIPGFFTFPDFYSWLADQMPSDRASHGVEIGVASGQSASYLAVELINKSKFCVLDLVDFNPESRNQALKYLAPVKHIIGKFHVCLSVEASLNYEDESLDFVFIDGSHDYNSIKEDINTWMPKVKSGGFLAGHDYAIQYFGIMKAVMESFDKWEVFKGKKWGLRSKKIIDDNNSEDYVQLPCWCSKI